jgi:predicted nucleic acid-binding protein
MIILDTNVLSELMKPTPSARVVAWAEKQSVSELFTTTITEAEIFYGIAILGKGKRSEGLLAAAEAMFTEDFRGRIFGFESGAARDFSRIAAHRSDLGKPIGHADAQIAAITRVHGAKRATRSVRNFVDCGIRNVINPWSID